MASAHSHSQYFDFGLIGFPNKPLPSPKKASTVRKALPESKQEARPMLRFPGNQGSPYLIALAAALLILGAHNRDRILSLRAPLLLRLATGPRRLLSQPQGRKAAQPRGSLPQEATGSLRETA